MTPNMSQEGHFNYCGLLSVKIPDLLIILSLNSRHVLGSCGYKSVCNVLVLQAFCVSGGLKSSDRLHASERPCRLCRFSLFLNKNCADVWKEKKQDNSGPELEVGPERLACPV